MSEAALSNFFAEFNSTELCAPAVKVAGGVKLDTAFVHRMDSGKSHRSFHPECWGHTPGPDGAANGH